jgi:uncharacterized damage-inducible protein DinB
MQVALKQLFERDLDNLSKEIAAYSDEAVLWQIAGNISNSSGNLTLHLMGNLRTYIGKNLGNIPYERNRPAEFSLKNIPKSELLAAIDETRSIIVNTLEQLSAQELINTYPEEVLGYPMTTQYFLIHLQGHLQYHLGQINYHRRLLV